MDFTTRFIMVHGTRVRYRRKCSQAHMNSLRSSLKPRKKKMWESKCFKYYGLLNKLDGFDWSHYDLGSTKLVIPDNIDRSQIPVFKRETIDGLTDNYYWLKNVMTKEKKLYCVIHKE